MPKRLLFSLCAAGLVAISFGPGQHNSVVTDAHGAIIRGDTTKKQVALVFTGDEFADGGETIRQTLKTRDIPGSFFLTGNFYSNKAFRKLVAALKSDGHYLGAHSDKHLLYAPWAKRDSLLVTKEMFTSDFVDNYRRMAGYGVDARDAPYFLPPFEWYNATIVRWTEELGHILINFTPGTRSHADYTYPEMGDRYVSSDVIYRSIIEAERVSANGLNGFILLTHIGVDPRRKDKFYDRLDDLVMGLRSRGYEFVSISDLLDK